MIEDVYEVQRDMCLKDSKYTFRWRSFQNKII